MAGTQPAERRQHGAERQGGSRPRTPSSPTRFEWMRPRAGAEGQTEGPGLTTLPNFPPVGTPGKFLGTWVPLPTVGESQQVCVRNSARSVGWPPRHPVAGAGRTSAPERPMFNNWDFKNPRRCQEAVGCPTGAISSLPPIPLPPDSYIYTPTRHSLDAFQRFTQSVDSLTTEFNTENSFISK